MILYTVLPMELVLEGIERERQFTDVELGGVAMTIEPISAEEAVIIRIISTDPRDFLDPALQPGRILRFSPTVSALNDPVAMRSMDR